MKGKTAVINRTGDHEENIQRWAKNLGIAGLRRALFNEIYGRVSRPRSKNQLATDAKVKNDQQVQNELEYLYRKDLIERMDNEGVSHDRARYLYFKDESVRAHKNAIVRAADNKAVRENMPTKRAPKLNGKTVFRTVTRAALKKRKRVDVLYLMANPIRRHSLRVDAEISKVLEEIRGSPYRDNIVLHQAPAANLNTIIRGLNDHRPRIVHFSGHGNSSGLATDDGGIKRVKAQFVTFDLLGKAFAATDTPPDVVVLNACNSAGARAALLGSAKVIVVMQASISDVAAVAFATKFYGAIASGQSVQAAFDQGSVAIQMVSLREAGTPAMLTAANVNARKLILA